MALALRFAARSDVGLIRDGNEDSAYAGPRLLVVADGMGGHAAGEVASSVAVATLAALDEDSPGPKLLDRLAAAVQTANDHLRDMVEGDRALQGMGTTLTALLRAGPRFGLVHVGDSRCYLLRGGELVQVTHDDTFVQTLVDEGRITAEEADHHPQRSLLTNALDGRGAVEMHLSIREARPGDRWMLCSDGLSGVVSAETLHETLSRGDVEAAAAKLVELALRGGGPDNVTVIVADVVDVDSSPSDIPQVVGAAATGPVRRSDRRGDNAPSAAERARALRRSPDAADDDRHGGPLGGSGTARRWAVRLAVLAVALALVAATGYGAWAWSREQYWVGADDTGEVVIFQGPDQSVFGVSLYSSYEETGVPASGLPQFSRGRVEDGIGAADLARAREIAGRLSAEAQACARPVATPTPTPTPTPTTPTSSPEPTGTQPTGTQPTGTQSPPPVAAPTAGPAPSPSPEPPPEPASPPRPAGCPEST